VEKEMPPRYNWSEGVGTISYELMMEEKDRLGETELPSALQIRCGGAKGMVSLDKRLEGRVLCIRRSQNKFESRSEVLTLETNEVARYNRGHLNRDIITLLSSLGVPDETLMLVHKEALDTMVNTILDASREHDARSSIELLTQQTPVKGSTTAAALELLRRGGPFDLAEPHLRGIVLAVQVFCIV
jgi:RNA-dependent RNA polymerase